MFKKAYLELISSIKILFIIKDRGLRLSFFEVIDDVFDVLNVVSGRSASRSVHIRVLLDINDLLIKFFLFLVKCE
jgi:hypothetical protein